MADKIKGITVEIGGDTTGLDNALKNVNNTSRSLSSELSQVQKLLKFDPNNAELLAQKQQLLNNQVEATSDKLNTLKSVQAQVQAQFDAGDLGEDKYRAFQREIANTEITLRNTQTALSNMGNEQTAVKQKTQDLKNVFAITETTLESYTDLLGNRLVNAIKNGTATSGQLQQAFNKIGTAATGSQTGVKELQAQIQRLDQGAADIAQLRTEFKQLGSAAEEAESAVKGVGSEMSSVIAGVAAGGGLAAAVTKALDVSSLDTKIDVSFNVPEESKASVLEAVNGVKSYGIDAQAALEAVRRQWSLNGDATDASNQKIVASASAIAASFDGIDLTELIQETNEMSGSLGMSQQEALGMTNALLKMGFPPEQLDIITEYGSQLSRAGYSAEEIQGIFAAGIETDSWNIDVLLDGVKEGRIVMAEFGSGVDETTTKLIEGTTISAQQLQAWGKDVAAGGAAGKTAMTEVTTALMGIEDETKRNQVGVKLFGTLWEENGDKIGQTILGASDKTVDLKNNNDQLNDSVSRLNEDPQVRLNKALTDMQTALTPLLSVIAEAVAKVADWAARNPELAATIAAIVAVVGTIIGLVTALTPLIMSLTVAAGGLNIAMLPITGTILAVIAAITAIIAIGVLLYKNWDEITAAGKKLNDKIEEFFKNIAKVIDEKITEAKEAIVKQWTEALDKTKEKIEEMKTKVKETFENMLTGIKEKTESIKQTISDKFTESKEKVLEIMQNIKTDLQEKWESIKIFLQETIENILRNITEKTESIKQTISNKFTETKDKVFEIMQNIKADLQAKWESIKTDIQEKATNIVTTIRTKFEEFKNAIQEKMQAAYAKIQEIWATVRSFFNGISLTEIGRKIINTLITGFANMAGNLRSKASDLFNNVKSFFNGVSLYDIGRKIIQGLINGIGSMASALWAKATSLASGIGRKIKDALKVKSPSRVTMEIGEYTGEGLIEGLDHTVAKVKAMAAKLAGAAVPSTGGYMTEAQAAFLNKNRSRVATGIKTGLAAAAQNKSYVVNLHSPKALDVREAIKLFQRTVNKMSLMW